VMDSRIFLYFAKNFVLIYKILQFNTKFIILHKQEIHAQNQIGSGHSPNRCSPFTPLFYRSPEGL